MWASVLDAVILCVILQDAMSVGVGVRCRIGGSHCQLQCRCRRQFRMSCIGVAFFECTVDGLVIALSAMFDGSR